jgi:small subunit ribosomal protein S5
MAGGRRFNFSIAIVHRRQEGSRRRRSRQGCDTALAIDKATRDAKKHMITIPRTQEQFDPHDVSAKYASSTVELIPSKGRGLVAGSAVRTVLELGGVTDVVSKIHSRSKNKLTIARATVAALKQLEALK